MRLKNMSDLKELVSNLEVALKELKVALELDSQEEQENVTNQKTNEELFDELSIRF
jgi:hypothetical protein